MLPKLTPVLMLQRSVNYDKLVDHFSNQARFSNTSLNYEDSPSYNTVYQFTSSSKRSGGY